LYYIWFRLNSLLTEIHESIEDGRVTIERYRKMENVSFLPIKLNYIDNEIRRKNVLLLDELNTEKNHLIYLKYFNDEGLINFFDSVPEKISTTVKSILSINQIAYEDKPAESDYYEKMKSSILEFYDTLKIDYISESTNVPEINIKFIKSYLAIYVDSLINDTIEFDEFQSLAQYIMNILEKFVYTLPSLYTKTYDMKELAFYSKQKFYEVKVSDLKWQLTGLSLFRMSSQIFLSKIKSKSKIPIPV
jgi:hypothetical protein